MNLNSVMSPLIFQEMLHLQGNQVMNYLFYESSFLSHLIKRKKGNLLTIQYPPGSNTGLRASSSAITIFSAESDSTWASGCAASILNRIANFRHFLHYCRLSRWAQRFYYHRTCWFHLHVHGLLECRFPCNKRSTTWTNRRKVPINSKLLWLLRPCM